MVSKVFIIQLAGIIFWEEYISTVDKSFDNIWLFTMLKEESAVICAQDLFVRRTNTTATINLENNKIVNNIKKYRIKNSPIFFYKLSLQKFGNIL